MPKTKTGSRSFREDESSSDVRVQVRGYSPYRGEDADDHRKFMSHWQRVAAEAGLRNSGARYCTVQIHYGVCQLVVESYADIELGLAQELSEIFKKIGLEHVQIVEQVRSYRRYHV